MNIGEVVTVAPGVSRLVMPMPFELNHINLYLLDELDGWTLVDCGLDNAASREVWAGLLARVFTGKPIKRIVVTHYHPDHIGLAAWLQRLTGARVLISRGEMNAAHTAMRDDSHGGTRRDRFTAFGLRGDGLSDCLERGLRYGRLVKELPDDVDHLATGQELVAGEFRWRVVIGRGHSPEQICLFAPESRVLITGDHILPTITPNVSINATSSNSPLHDYICTLRHMEKLGADFYLPAHGEPAHNVNLRIKALLQHHYRELDEIVSGWEGVRTVTDCADAMFGAQSVGQLGFALGEAAAHLVYLEREDMLARDTVDGRWLFRLKSRGAEPRRAREAAGCE